MDAAGQSGGVRSTTTIGADGFAAFLKRLRLAARLTQEDLAARSGVNVRSVRYIERGRIRSPRPETARLLGAALGLSGAGLDDFVARARADYWAGRDEAVAQNSPVRSLPRRIPDVVGRAAEVARIRAAAGGGDPCVVAIDGMAGVGKTTLAIEVASELGERYPDAHLYLDLHGHSGRSPVEPVEAAGLLLRQLGVPTQGIPAGRHRGNRSVSCA